MNLDGFYYVDRVAGFEDDGLGPPFFSKPLVAAAVSSSVISDLRRRSPTYGTFLAMPESYRGAPAPSTALASRRTAPSLTSSCAHWGGPS